jgi:hypothetical protein
MKTLISLVVLVVIVIKSVFGFVDVSSEVVRGNTLKTSRVYGISSCH